MNIKKLELFHGVLIEFMHGSDNCTLEKYVDDFTIPNGECVYDFISEEDKKKVFEENKAWLITIYFSCKWNDNYLCIGSNINKLIEYMLLEIHENKLGSINN